MGKYGWEKQLELCPLFDKGVSRVEIKEQFIVALGSGIVISL